MENYTGKIVFVERTDKDTYYNGEYAILKQTPNSLYGIKLGGGYSSHEIKQFPLKGERSYSVVSADEDDKLLLQLADDMEKFASTPAASRQWVASVYECVGQNVVSLRRAIKEKNDVKETTVAVGNAPFAAPYVPYAHVSINIAGSAEEVKKAIAELNAQLNSN